LCDSCGVITFALIFIIFINLFNLPTSYSQIAGNNKRICECVVFRVDDIQDRYVDSSQLAIMNMFLQKNESLSLGLISNFLGNDTSIINKIYDGLHTGKFELASHGWNHENFSKFSKNDQLALLNKSNEKINKMFGIRSAIFIPPSFDFNNLTLDAMRELGFRIISSNDRFYTGMNRSDDRSDLIANFVHSNNADKNNIFHFPSTVQYSYFENNKWNTYPVEQALAKVNKSISTYGYAIVTLHPQAFAISQNGNLTDSVNATELSKLNLLVDSIISRKIPITTFYNLSVIPDDNRSISTSKIKNSD